MAKALPVKTKKPPRGYKQNAGHPLPEEVRNEEKPIVDALDYLEIRLTAADIRAGEPLNPGKCAFARAVDREYKVKAYIWRSIAYVDFGETIVRFRVPQSVRTELVSVDRKGDMVAGEY